MSSHTYARRASGASSYCATFSRFFLSLGGGKDVSVIFFSSCVPLARVHVSTVVFRFSLYRFAPARSLCDKCWQSPRAVFLRGLFWDGRDIFAPRIGRQICCLFNVPEYKRLFKFVISFGMSETQHSCVMPICPIAALLVVEYHHLQVMSCNIYILYLKNPQRSINTTY